MKFFHKFSKNFLKQCYRDIFGKYSKFGPLPRNLVLKSTMVSHQNSSCNSLGNFSSDSCRIFYMELFRNSFDNSLINSSSVFSKNCSEIPSEMCTGSLMRFILEFLRRFYWKFPQERDQEYVQEFFQEFIRYISLEIFIP